MAYGTENGVSNNISDYEVLIDNEQITEDMVSDSRYSADGIIDMRLAKIVPAANLPVSSPPAALNSISDDLTTYFLLRRLFTGKDPNDSAWVDKFYVRPLQLLDDIIKNPQSISVSTSPSPVTNDVKSSTLNNNRIFSIATTQGGNAASGDDNGSMDVW